MSQRAFLSGKLRLILAITLVHAITWFAYYSQIPAGQYPNDAARTTLEAARAISEGTPSELSGHSLYTYALSLLALFLEDSASLTSGARGLNTLAILIATGFSASAAGYYWQRKRAVWISGLLVGLNPVLIFWSGEVSPALLATACMSVALWRLVRWLRQPTGRDSIWIALSLSLAAAFSTSLVPLALIWPLLACAFAKRERSLHGVLALIPTAAITALLLFSSLQLQNPLQWNTDQFGLGFYHALGNQESYDTKSYSLYRQLHLLLYINPIHWGGLFILAGLGAYVRLKDGHTGRSVLLAVVILAIFATSFAVNSGGSQARASLIPLLAIFAAGASLIPKIWKHASPRTQRQIIFGTLCISLFSYAGYLGAAQSKSWERDYSYLARANIALDNNDRAATWAEQALELNPNLHEMQEVLVLAQFNDWAMSRKPNSIPIEMAKEFLEASRLTEDTPSTYTIEGIYLYKLREIEAANQIWLSQRESSALALLCLYWTGYVLELTQNDIRSYSEDPYYDLLAEAVQVDRNSLTYSSLEKRLDNMLAFAY